MCAAMSPKEQNISKPVAASMAFAIFYNQWVVGILNFTFTLSAAVYYCI